ncbi:hypothetical protein EV421DRAFT_2024123 [Armillaria borealis]|uniref:Uncharacterized protein n=1 Tax=Armillaria borealis TaxID=47425 RepID=A0AA39IX94_9AGAR|nr:hypothetical protein EV421DRAFT_2024123 [Armillaria borealis]
MFNKHDKASVSLLVFAEGITAKLHEKESLDGHLVNGLSVAVITYASLSMPERYYRAVPTRGLSSAIPEHSQCLNAIFRNCTEVLNNPMRTRMETLLIYELIAVPDSSCYGRAFSLKILRYGQRLVVYFCLLGLPYSGRRFSQFLRPSSFYQRPYTALKTTTMILYLGQTGFTTRFDNVALWNNAG